MELEVSLSRVAHEKIYVTWPEDVREQIEDGLALLRTVDPAGAKIAPSPPYAPHIGHLHSFKFKRNEIFQFMSVFYVFSNELDRVLVTDIAAQPGFQELASVSLPLEADKEYIEIPQRDEL